MSDGARPPHDAADASLASEAAHRAFAETSDPAAYVPRPACEAVLERLVRWAAPGTAGPTVAVLVGSPGLGKTLLLRTLQKRVEGGVLYLPYAGLGPVDLAHWVYGLFGRTRERALDALAATAAAAADGAASAEDGEAAASAAVDALKALGGSAGPFFLLIDDADSMPLETVHALATRLPAIDSPLRLLLAVNPDARGSRLLAAFHAFVPLELVFRERMTVEETGEYVRARMRWAGFAEAEVARIDENAARHFHALSGGVPRALHAQAWSDFDRVLAEGEWPALDAKRRREEWMGQAIEAAEADAEDWAGADFADEVEAEAESEASVRAEGSVGAAGVEVAADERRDAKAEAEASVAAGATAGADRMGAERSAATIDSLEAEEGGESIQEQSEASREQERVEPDEETAAARRARRRRRRRR